ncbi:MAG: hypothetical protein SV375_05175 [Thermodesulfobacteriota bacterium]|nr:hypothetical protein [Thermodesulfobacteriota bacterium]
MSGNHANPVKGKGERYIYCSQDGGCVRYAASRRWPAFNCEKCEAYRGSEVYRKNISRERKEREKYMSDEKNQLIDLNDSLFKQMNRLTDENLDEKGLQKEILRSKAVSNLAAQIIQNARLALDGAKAIKAGLADQGTIMLGRGQDG